MENAYSTVTVVLLGVLILAVGVLAAMLAFLLGRNRQPSVYIQPVTTTGPALTTSTSSTTGTAGNYLVTTYTLRELAPEQAPEPAKPTDPAPEATQDDKPAPQCYCCQCGNGLYGDPNNQLVLDEVSYLVFGCDKCNDVTLKPLRTEG